MIFPRWAAIVLLAMGCGRSPPGPKPGADHSTSAVDSLIRAGEAHFRAERFDSARTVWTVALAASEGARDPVAGARALSQLALVAWQRGDMGQAEALAQRALDSGRTHGSAAEPERPHLVLGLVRLDEGRNQEAVEHFEAAADASRTAGDSAMMARAMGGLGNAHTYLGDLARGREYQRSQREIGRGLGNLRLEGNGLLNEAMIDIWMGDPRPAIAKIDTARALYRTSGFAVGEQHALGQLATAYERTGEDDLALAALDSALAIDRRLGIKQGEADELRLIAEVHARLGDYRRALRLYEEAEALMRRAGLEGNLGAVLRGKAIADMRLGNLPEAERGAVEALRIHTQSAEPLDRLDDLLLLAEIDFRRSGRAAATSRLAEARRVADAINTRGALIAVMLAEAELADRAGDPLGVLRVLDGGARLLAGGDFGADWMVLGLSARAYAQIGSIDSAVAIGRRAVQATDRVRSRLAGEPLRATFTADRAAIYADLVVALLRADRPAEAFSVADGARSRGLLVRLTASRADSGVMSPDLAASERLLRRIDSLVQRLRESGVDRRPDRGGEAGRRDDPITEALAGARSEYEALVTRAAQRAPRVARLLGVEPITLAGVQSALGSDQALVQYLITGDGLLTFVVTQKSLQVLQATLSTETLTEQIRLIRDFWGTPGQDWRLALPAARALHHTLIEPALASGDLNGIHRLLIVPHGILTQVPFGALPNGATNRFLVEDFSVVHLPSAGVLTALGTREASHPLANGPGISFAPFPADLPASKTEVESIRAAVPGTETRVGAKATEGAVRRALGQRGFVHLASHGVLNARNPLFSGIELFRARNGLDGDGRLEVHEILELPVRSSLVFFSGCETGARREWTDEPVLGTSDLTLAQATLAAGAENVVMTLWRIDDAGAAVFAEHFYRSLQGASLVDAFSAAQRAAIADRRFGSPYYWASYVLSGIGDSPGR